MPAELKCVESLLKETTKTSILQIIMNIIINAQYNIHVVQDTIQKSHNKKEKMWLISKKKKKKIGSNPEMIQMV